MEELRAYLKTLSPNEQAAFARRCGTSLSYLRKMISLAKSRGAKIGIDLALEIERESATKVRCEKMLPDLDWAQLRPSKKSHRAPAAA